MVSVIVPVLNNEVCIDACIQSILNQTYQDLELLLMVGMCDDASLSKCLSWQRLDERVIVVSRRDSSLGDARNYAMPIAKGEYIAYVDADDIIEKTFIQEMVEPLEKDGEIDFSVCGYKKSGQKSSETYLPKAEGRQEIDFSSYWELGISVTVWCKIYRKSYLAGNCIQMFDGTCEDESHNCMLAATARTIYIVRDALYYYTVDNPASLMSKQEFKGRMDYVRSMEFAIRYLQDRKIYDSARNVLRDRICYALQSFLVKFDFDEEMADLYQDFVKSRFPEMLGFMSFAQKTMTCSEVVVYGAGQAARQLLASRSQWVDVKYIVDSNPSLAGTYLEGIPIKHKDELLKEARTMNVVIATSKYFFPVFRELHALGFCNIYDESVLMRGK